MSTADSIASSQTKQSPWRKSGTTWTLGLFGTAIGAGVLFFPTRVGFGGLTPILIILVLTYPIALYCHRALARLCPSGSNPSGDIIETAEEHFDKTGSVVITFLCFFAICPLLRIYGVTIINTFTTFWENQLQMPVLNRGFVALLLLLLMTSVIWSGKDLMVKVMSYLVWPPIAGLVFISLSLILYWNSAVIDQADINNIILTGHNGILATVWLDISIMVFSFNFSPIVSSFVTFKREEHEKDYGREFTEQKCFKIIFRVSMLTIMVIMFFVLSRLFTLSPANMANTKAQNIPVSSYLVDHFIPLSGTRSTFATVLEYGASIIALVAIFKSFFGRYLGTLEGLNDLVPKFGYRDDKTKVSVGKLNTISMILIMGSTQAVTYANPNILNPIEAMGVSIIASLLCLLLMYAIRKTPSLAEYRGRLDNVFVTAVGLLTIPNTAYKLL